ncbi:MAG: hypothetical protein U1E23_03590 [Reyranellaceae bacterium]
MDGELTVTPTDNRAIVKIGDDSVWGYRLKGGAAILSHSQCFRNKLEAMLLENQEELSPICRWEVDRIFGTLSERQSALVALCKRLKQKSKSLHDHWLRNLFALPTLRQELLAENWSENERATLHQYLPTLSLVFSGSKIGVSASREIVSLLGQNKDTFDRAALRAASEWEGTGLSKKIVIPESKDDDLPNRSSAMVRIEDTHASVFYSRMWPKIDGLLVQKLMVSLLIGLRIQIDKAKVVESSTSVKYVLPPSRGLKSLNLLCSFEINKSDINILMEDSSNSINVVVFRNATEALEMASKWRKSEGEAGIRVDQFWICQPRYSGKDSRLAHQPLSKEVKYLGYLENISLEAALLYGSLADRSKFATIVADEHTIGSALLLLKNIAKVFHDVQEIVVQPVVVLVRATQRSVPGIGATVKAVDGALVSSPGIPGDLIKRSSIVISYLPFFHAGFVRNYKGPLILAASRDNSQILNHFTVAKTLNASTLEHDYDSDLDPDLQSRNLEKAVVEAIHAARNPSLPGRKTYCEGTLNALRWYRRLSSIGE